MYPSADGRLVEIPEGMTIGDGATIADNVRFGEKDVIGDYVTLASGVVLGDFVGIGCNSSIGLDNDIENDVQLLGKVVTGAACTFCEGAKVKGPGTTTFGDEVFVGPRAVFEGSRTIGRNATIGEDSLILRDIADDEEIEPGWTAYEDNGVPKAAQPRHRCRPLVK